MAGFEVPAAIEDFVWKGLRCGSEGGWAEGGVGADDGVGDALDEDIVVGGGGFRAGVYGRTAVSVGGANEHFLRVHAGLFGGDGFGLIQHLRASAEYVHHDHGDSGFSVVQH